MTYDIDMLKKLNYDAGREDAEKVSKWYMEDYVVEIEYGDDEDRHFSKEDQEYLANWAHKICRKYNGHNQASVDEKYFIYSECFTLTKEQLDAFKKDTQEMVDYAWNLNAFLRVEGYMIAEDENTDAAIKLSVEKNTVEIAYHIS